jgi:PAS domain S-box-containing protein
MTVVQGPELPESPDSLDLDVSQGTTEAAAGAGGAFNAESAGLYRLLVDRVTDYAIFALDPGGHIISWNEGAARLKGYSAHEIIGRHFTVFYPPADIAAGKPEWELEEATRVGRVEDEGWRIRKDGSRFWASVVITALRDSTGSLVGFAKVTRDLTERWRADEVLRQSEERFRLLVHCVKDYAIFMLDPDGRVMSWNEGAERINGYTAEEIIGRHFATFYPAADIAARKPERELAIAARVGKYEEEGWRLRKDGTSIWVNVLITAVRDGKGEIIGYAKVTRDLTERRAAQERAIADARRIAEAESSSRTKTEFLTSLSHELRTPINATLGYADLLDIQVGGPINEQQREYVARIRASQEHLLRVITDLLNYSRMEAGHVHFEVADVRVQEVVDTVLPMVEPQAAAKGTRIISESANELVWRTDRARTEQILLNLVANAVKFTPPGGTIEVSCEETGDCIVVAVSDTGPGIPADQQGPIFEPFVQVGRSLTSSHEGTGLGLSISRRLARALGGDVTVESELDKGSTFRLSLPGV